MSEQGQVQSRAEQRRVPIEDQLFRDDADQWWVAWPYGAQHPRGPFPTKDAAIRFAVEAGL